LLASLKRGGLHATALAARRILDNLPVAMVRMRKDERAYTMVKLYERGYPVGFAATTEVGGEIACLHARTHAHTHTHAHVDALC